MKVIKLTEDCYAQPQGILLIHAEPGIAMYAPMSVREEWNARPNKSSDPLERMMLPAIRVLVADQKNVMIHFATEEARDKHFAMLVKKWKEA